MSLLYIAQKQNNTYTTGSHEVYRKIFDMPYIKVYEVATFYSMYNLALLESILYKFVLQHHV